MSVNTSVKDFAAELKVPVDTLLDQLNLAGVPKKSGLDVISEEDKEKLLQTLRNAHSQTAEPARRKKITLTKRTTSEIKQADPSGKSRTIQVEVRKKRVFVKKKSYDDNPIEVNTDSPQESDLQSDFEKRKFIGNNEINLQEATNEGEELAIPTEKTSSPGTLKESCSANTKNKIDQGEEAGRSNVDSEVAEINAFMTSEKSSDEKLKKVEKESVNKPQASKDTTTLKVTLPSDREKPGLKAKKTEKSVKASKLSSTWKEEQRQKRIIKTRGDVTGGTGGWRPHKVKSKATNNAQKQDEAENVVEFVVREVNVPETITVAELAHKMAFKGSEVIKVLMTMGQMVTINQVLDQETAMIVVEEMGHKAFAAKLDDPELFLEESELHSTKDVELLPRPPVVTIMGHVDHGKTSLLDLIRTTKVVDSEAGGITQHIGAYHVVSDKGTVTFLDTPGHEAFTAMRARGANATDIVILVVAADDGVMPQTKEAIAHARAAGVPIIVAVNKIDKPEANIERVKSELISEEVVPEDFGGDSPFVPVSAKTGEGLDELLENILLQAEILELKAPVASMAKGLIVEASIDKGRGPVATVLVQSGTLNKGDVVLAGASFGRIRALLDENNRQIQSAGPSIPAEILGLTDVPQSGDELLVLGNEKKAREIALFRQGKFRDVRLAKQQAAKLENVFENMGGENKDLPLIVKADVHGSQEAVSLSLQKLSNQEIKIRMVHSAVGPVTESDVNLAIASRAVIIGFNVRADAASKRLADLNEIDIRYYNVIYDAVKDVKDALQGMLAPEIKEEVTGLVEIRQVFKVSKLGKIAGCMVLEGIVKKSASVRLLRENVVIWTGELESLKRFKDDIKEVKEGYECGLTLRGYNDIKEGDQLEVFEVREIARAL
ncbi:MAG: translation initiation factor IF-2 [Burkholderiaceae bacterium]|nr:MAG: translation initiation factor IF-2 [Burkholderiaceae bacterium]